ncbi:MAG: allantoate amidohydrolase [Streptosporangiaceae bacterium]
MNTDSALAKDFTETFGAVSDIGRDPSGGYLRFAWTDEDRVARAWFAEEAASRGLAYERDRNGNLWAWWGDPTQGDALVLGSHLDTVPRGGAYDGALGVVSGLVAISAAREAGAEPRRPVAVAAFAEEEGGRFGVPTLGSGLLTGALHPDDVTNRRETSGGTLGQAMRSDALATGEIGEDKDLLSRLGAYAELHVEQGRALVDVGAPLGLGTSIWPHGRWRLHLAGELNHAGTTTLDDRKDPMIVLARAILTARERAGQLGAVATIGRVMADPNNTNSVAESVDAWLDARASNDIALDELVESVRVDTRLVGARGGVATEVISESRSPEVDFDIGLSSRLKETLRGRGLPAPDLAIAAGHDAGNFANLVPTAMLFVRNPTGASHCPGEYASDTDCVLGCAVLTDFVIDWVRG